jgi:hypothetical protein
MFSKGIAMNKPVTPTWFNMRQGKAEPVGEEALKLTAPNLPESYLGVRQAEDKTWVGTLRTAAEGEELAATPVSYRSKGEAFQAAFELYRTRIVT